ncbi:hypothetical protein ACJMK2_019432 [Sinanodonta woodiana]|uniref:Uncharacterized protein n=1 Tax=Sinanodonta woodiana TaxID=1069815 RepID=A0ABD3UGF4_SINWO
MKTETPILTLFTSWLHRYDKYVVQNITVQNWKYVRPHSHPVLWAIYITNNTELGDISLMTPNWAIYITNDTELGDIYRRHGWSILPLTHTAIEGVPVVKYMYLDAMRHFNSTFYGFANADILFNDGLVNTLLTIRKFTDIYRDPVLVTGIRINFDYKIPCKAKDMKNISKVSEKGKLANPMSADYFITTRDYPWWKMEEIVIGRINKIFVINSTPTVIALHQSTEAGILRINKINTGCAEFVTNFTKEGHIQLTRQPFTKQMLKMPGGKIFNFHHRGFCGQYILTMSVPLCHLDKSQSPVCQPCFATCLYRVAMWLVVNE